MGRRVTQPVTLPPPILPHKGGGADPVRVSIPPNPPADTLPLVGLRGDSEAGGSLLWSEPSQEGHEGYARMAGEGVGEPSGLSPPSPLWGGIEGGGSQGNKSIGSPLDSLGAIYLGDVVHKRARPKRHSLRYRVFSMLVDLDRLDSLDQQLRLFSLNGFNLFSFYEKDFGPRDGTSIAVFLRRKAHADGLGDVARIRMLAYPRILGFAFNPITVYFLDDADGVTRMIVYEVHNTFGGHHFYQARVDGRSGELHHSSAKAFYVSPFNTLEGTYRFTIRPPAEDVFIGITLSTGEGGLVTAYFDGERKGLGDLRLLQLALAYPLMTIKVVWGIHWEAFRLWLKGVPLTLGLRRKLSGSDAARR